MVEPNLKPIEAAARLRISVYTLKNWRVQGIGPRFVKFGRVVLYPVVNIEQWERENSYQANSIKCDP